MRDEDEFSEGRHGPVVPVPTGKARITIRLDDDVVAWFKQQVHQAGGGNYQTLNRAREPLERTLRRVIREELRRAR